MYPPNNGYPNYSMPNQDSFYFFRQQAQEKQMIRQRSLGAAAATAGFFLLAAVLYRLYYLLPGAVFSPESEADLMVYYSVDLLITMLSLVVPFAVVYYFFTTRLKITPIPLGRPQLGAGDTLLFLFAGSGLLLASSYFTSSLSYYFQIFTGITFLYTDTPVPESAFGLLLYYVRMALFPAIAEEFAMRGVVMQSLRRWGDWFAMTMSALVFALMHGNMVQVPFAFLAGWILGYAVIRTGSLWTGILIHFINNTFSLTGSLLTAMDSTTATMLFNSVGSSILIGGGVICAVVLGLRHQLPRPARNITVLPNGQCYKSFIVTAPMILVLVYMFIQTMTMVDVPYLTDWFYSLIGWLFA